MGAAAAVVVTGTQRITTVVALVSGVATPLLAGTVAIYACGPTRRSDPSYPRVVTGAIENLTELVDRAAPAQQPALALKWKQVIVVAAARVHPQCAGPAPAVTHDLTPTPREQAG